MTIKELAEYCHNLKHFCHRCQYEKECDTLQDKLKNIRPDSLVEMIEKDENLTEKQDKAKLEKENIIKKKKGEI